MTIEARDLKKNYFFRYNNNTFCAVSDWSIVGKIHAVSEENYNPNGVYAYDVVDILELAPNEPVLMLGE